MVALRRHALGGADVVAALIPCLSHESPTVLNYAIEILSRIGLDAVALGRSLTLRTLRMTVRGRARGITRCGEGDARTTRHRHADPQRDGQRTDPADESGCASWQLLTTVDRHATPLYPD